MHETRHRIARQSIDETQYLRANQKNNVTLKLIVSHDYPEALSPRAMIYANHEPGETQYCHASQVESETHHMSASH